MNGRGGSCERTMLPRGVLAAAILFSFEDNAPTREREAKAVMLQEFFFFVCNPTSR